jgi:glyoxylase-like metal-dependent hydrolase (beta-lactamase superfamily II)
LGLSLQLAIVGAAEAQQNFDNVQIRPTRVTDNIYMLQGSGGNIGLSFGEDGTFIIDDQYAPLSNRIEDAIAALTPTPVQFVINTHWHYDHSGGNENFGAAGAVIVAHENSRRRMESPQFVAAGSVNQIPYNRDGLPKITFGDRMRFHMNGDSVDIVHVEHAHTNGDAFVYFRDSNVIHTGDVFVRYGLPFIDQANGGSIDGIIRATYLIAGVINDRTVVIPGHGAIATRADLLAYGQMLSTIRDRVAARIAAGDSFDQMVATNPLEGLPQRGVGSAADFLHTVYDSLVEELVQ